MEKFPPLKVPKGTQFISEWKEYSIPRGEHFIVDKGVTGCGYTEYCLTNKDNIVLCSPRKLLLENKRDQHLRDINIIYLENDIENHSDVQDFESKIIEHIQLCLFKKLPVKIMVTYDSLHYVSEFLCRNNTVGNYIFVIDEFQSIFLDSFFKSEVELNFVESLQSCPNVIYLSATPMLDKYLDRLDHFKDLKYFKLDWSNTGYVETVKIQRKRVASLGSECGKIIKKYLNNEFPTTVNSNNIPVESREAVFYFNSVSDIIRVVKKHSLTPDNTLIICSRTRENEEKLKKIKFQIGRVPLKGEKYPMFIFCTSTSYIGIDFYSTCASTYVFADPNIESLALDISLDLPQIIGRQRDKSNPFKNDIVLFYKTKRNGENELSEKEFKELQEKRKAETKTLLDLYNSASSIQKSAYVQKLKDSIEVSQYSRDFVSISKNTNLPVYNYLIEISNERAWDVSRKDYQDQISVTKSLEETGYIVSEFESEEDRIVSDFLDNHFYKTGRFEDKMKMYCDFCDIYRDNQDIMSSLDHKIKDSKFKGYYTFYGTSGCSSRYFEEKKLISGFRDYMKGDKLETLVYTNFKTGGRYAMKEIKQKLSEIYSLLGISRTPKATDLGKYFKLTKTKVTLPDKTVKDGFKLEVL